MRERRAFSKSFAVSAVLAGVLMLPAAALADNLSVEITTAATHAGFSAAASDLATAHTHLHHTLNCLVGPGGKGFDTNALNPCKGNGNGAIPDSTDPNVTTALKGLANEARAGLASNDLATVKKDAADIEAQLKALKSQ
jgi:hypothetical protein